MSRRIITFACEGATLFGTLDHAPGTSGLLIVSGGNEIRSGAWAGQALLAARIAKAGFPVFRFDRRGIGDSDGPNGGFRTAQPDIAAAIAAFRAAAPGVTRIVGCGNCDAASALMLGGGVGFSGLLLSNPWTFADNSAEDGGGHDPALPVQALRSYYRDRLGNFAAVKRLLTGKVSFASLIAGVGGTMRRSPPPTTLALDMADGLARFGGAVAILIAGRDRTAQAFLAGWDRKDGRLRICAKASHSFVEAEARDWVVGEVLRVLHGVAT